jgi:nucleotide-binding universal stress UspA family protein
MVSVYENVIVPFDGTLPARAVLAPAADLAWRCGARIVIVNNTEASDQASKQSLKSRAMSMSGADVDFWVDLDHSLGRAIVEASKFRPNCIVCVPVRTKASTFRRRTVLGATPAEVLLEAAVPVLVIGPETDVSRGLPMTEIVVSLDGSTESEQVLPLAIDWAKQLKLRLTLAGVVRASDGNGDHTAEREYLSNHLSKAQREVPESGLELVEANDPATGLCELLATRDTAIIALSTHGRSGVDRHPLGSVAQAVMLRSPRAVLFQRPRP